MNPPSRTPRLRVLALPLLLATGAALTAYAYTATNVVGGTTRLGSGATAISGFAISNVVYRQQPSDRSRIQRVDFDLAPAATTVFAKVVSSSPTFRVCNLSAGNTHARCQWPAATAPLVAQADRLRVIASR